MAPFSTILGSRQQSAQQILDDIESQFQLDDDRLRAITSQFLKEVETGLGEYNHPMAMIPTFVTGVPNGTETGTFLALDLGGTNLRVCEVELHGDKTFSLRQQKYRLSEQLKTGEAKALFDYLADSVDAFLTSSASTASLPEGEELPLGLTFSFPVEQTALDEGFLLTWTKGFSAKNAKGNDIVKLLQDAFNRKHLHVKCVALVNDTVGALLSRSYTAGGCILGAIFGTGTNGAYLEDVSKIKKLANNPEVLAKGGKMTVNTEWGGFNNTRTTLPTTAFDNKLDRESINPRFQAFEKFISGMYLGEVARNILLALIDAAPEPLLFGGWAGSGVLNKHYGFDSAVMSAIEEAWEGNADAEFENQDQRVGDETVTDGKKELNSDLSESLSGSLWELDPEKLEDQEKKRLERVKKVIIQSLGFENTPEHVSLKDAAIVRWACTLVATRAAKLSGCAVAAIVIQTGLATLGGKDELKPNELLNESGKIGVGVDGSLIQHYPNFEVQLRVSLKTLVGAAVEKKVQIGLAKDGSGVGAALCALQAIKQASEASAKSKPSHL